MTLIKDRKVPVVTTSPVDSLAREIFGQNIGRFFGSDGFMEHAPRVNIVENDTDYRVEVQVPGFNKKDLHVDMIDDALTIRGETSEEANMEEEQYTRREFSRSSFERSFVLPKSVKAEAIKADYANGVLNLRIPKSEESKPKTRTISIH